MSVYFSAGLVLGAGAILVYWLVSQLTAAHWIMGGFLTAFVSIWLLAGKLAGWWA